MHLLYAPRAFAFLDSLCKIPLRKSASLLRTCNYESGAKAESSRLRSNEVWPAPELKSQGLKRRAVISSKGTRVRNSEFL